MRVNISNAGLLLSYSRIPIFPVDVAGHVADNVLGYDTFCKEFELFIRKDGRTLRVDLFEEFVFLFL